MRNVFLNLHLFIGLLSLLFVLGCESDPYLTYSFANKNFKQSKIIPVKIKKLDSIYGKNICISDGHIIIRTDYGKDFFHVIDLKKEEYLGSFGDEITLRSKNPMCFCQNYIFQGKSNFPVFIDEAKKIYYFSLLDKSLTTTINAPDIYLPTSYFIVDNGKRLIGSQGADGSVFNYNFENSTIHWTYDRPKMDIKFSRDVANFVYTNRSSINEKRKRLVVAYYLFNNIDIFSYEGELIQSFSFKDNTRRKPAINEIGMPLPDTKVHYLNVKTVNDNIYLYYSGKAFEKSIDKTIQMSEIHVVNFNGEPQKLITINEKIIDFVITPDESKLYALIRTDDASNLIKLNLKK